ncbi:MAG: sodium:solute symporter family protein [Tenuifilum sp.]|uniref:sodium:solute symporter family protein n=2 Tax=Tenuifilum sp. TaxID=2760880 RepID=UPI001B450805|nr:sodium:solute symporter family protein [Bacteroidales bacterium]HOK87069.1 sodium:solute symporter family protein [Tenuifilum sp.]MBP9030279.1 sodium:solute symporter family protein [Bacteroidales bacterium]HON71440.1 sodium:solute symporter family protein [Tenuifilum sp.]HQG73339.1 sodium:solute symporter family protein [Tenuifilum sp.]
MEALLGNIYFWIVIAYFAIVVGVSFLTRKVASRSVADYLVAGRNLGIMLCSVVVAAEWLGGMSTIGVSEKAFQKLSFQPILYNVATSIGMIIIGFTVAKHYRKNNVHTVSEMLEHLFGIHAKRVSAIAFLIAYITLAYVQLQTATSVMSSIFQIDWLTSVIIGAGVITLYTYIGGMHALAITSIVHLVVMFVGLGTAMVIGVVKIGGFAHLQELLAAKGAVGSIYNPFGVSFNEAFSLLLGGVLGGMAAQASIQPIFAARTPEVAKKASILSSAYIAPFGVMTAILGLIAATGVYEIGASAPSFSAKVAMTNLLVNPQFIHPILGGLALAGILAAILSTVGPVNFAVVTIATKDIYHGFINPEADEQKVLQIARRLVIIVSLITIPLAYYFKAGVLDSAYISYAIRAIGAIVIIAGIYFRGWIDVFTVKLAFIGGTIAVFLCIVADKLKWFHLDKTYGAVLFALAALVFGYIRRKFFVKE